MSFVSKTFEIEITEESFTPLLELMELTGKSYAQICKSGLERAALGLSLDIPLHVPDDWIKKEKLADSRSVLRLPTETLMCLDAMATRSNVSWGTLASFLTECEIYYSLTGLQEPLES